MDESTYICKLKKRSTIIWPFNIIKRRHENLCWIDPHFCPHNTPWIDPNFWGVLLSNSQNFEEHNGGRTRKATRNEIWKIRRCCSLEAMLLEMEHNLHWSLTQDLSRRTAYPLKPRPFSFSLQYSAPTLDHLVVSDIPAPQLFQHPNEPLNKQCIVIRHS